MYRVAVVEDETLIRTMLQINLEGEGYEVVTFTNGEEFLATGRFGYDAVLLDINLPGISGPEILRQIREQSQTTPVMMVTAFDQLDYKVETFEGGADDYLTKPFEMTELLLRIKALIRRSQGERALPSDQQLSFGGNEVNFASRVALTHDGREHLMTETEGKLLLFLARHPGESLSRTDILEEVWGMDVYPTPRTIDNFILQFRKLFEKKPESPRHFITVRGVGFLFEPNPD